MVRRAVSAKPHDTRPSVAELVGWRALLLAVFLTPLAMSDFGWLGFGQPFTADIYTEPKLFVLRVATFVALGAWSWAVLVDGRAVRRTKIDLWVLGFVAWLGVTTLFSIHAPTSVFGHYTRGEGLLTYVIYAVLFFLTVQFANKGSRLKEIAQAVFWSGAIVSLYAVFQFMGLDWVRDVPAALQGRAYSTLGNPLVLGNQLVFVLPISIALALAEKRIPWRAVYWSGTLLAGIALMATFSRSAWLGAAVACALMVAYAVFQKARIERTLDLSFAAGALVLMTLGILRSISVSSEVTNVATRLGDLFEFESGSGFTRVGLWQAALAATSDRPWTGFGLDTFRLLAPAYFEPRYASVGDYLAIPDNAHSYPMQLLATAGVIGLVLFLAVVGIAGWVSVRKTLAVRSASGGSTLLIVGAFWAAAAGYLVNLIASISMPGTTFMLWVAVAVVLSPSAWERPAPVKAGMRGFAFVTAGLCAVLVVASFVPLYADRQYLKGQTLGDQQARIQAAETAVRLAPYYDTYRVTRAVAYADAALQRMGGIAPGAAVDPTLLDGYRLAVQELEDARSFSPWEQDITTLQVIVYNVGGRSLDPAYFDDAIALAEEALQRFRFAPALRLQYAIALEGAGRTAQAQQQLEDLVAMEPRMPEAAVQLARVYVAQNDTQRARAVLQAAQSTAVGGNLIAAAIDALEQGAPLPAVTW